MHSVLDHRLIQEKDNIQNEIYLRIKVSNDDVCFYVEKIRGWLRGWMVVWNFVIWFQYFDGWVDEGFTVGIS